MKLVLRILRQSKFQVHAILHRFFRNHVYTARLGITKGLKRRGGISFIPGLMATTEEEVFLRSLDLRGQTVYDVGAAYGLFTIFLAKKVGRKGMVIAFEPNPKLCLSILENINVNGFTNVQVRQIALGKEKKIETLAFPPMSLGIGSLEKHERARILGSKRFRTVQVHVDSVDNQLVSGKLPKPDFVKIDVQGLELDVLSGMENTIAKYKPKILVEVHYIPYIDWKTENVANVLKFLIERGYSIYHVESKKTVRTCEGAQNIEEDDHLYATYH